MERMVVVMARKLKKNLRENLEQLVEFTTSILLRYMDFVLKET